MDRDIQVVTPPKDVCQLTQTESTLQAAHWKYPGHKSVTESHIKSSAYIFIVLHGPSSSW